MRQTYKGIIFDLGGVVQGLDWSPVVNSLLDIKPDLDIEVFKKAFYYDREAYFNRYSTGKIKKTEFWTMVANKLDMDVVCIDRLSESFKGLYSFVNVDLLTFLATMQGRYGLYVLSNACSEIEEKVIQDNRYTYLFDMMFFSHKIGYRKPDPRVYATVLGNLDISSQELVFVDNDVKNVRSAESAGFAGILYKGLESFKTDLYRILK